MALSLDGCVRMWWHTAVALLLLDLCHFSVFTGPHAGLAF
jgi:hypothetical protein